MDSRSHKGDHLIQRIGESRERIEVLKSRYDEERRRLSQMSSPDTQDPSPIVNLEEDNSPEDSGKGKDGLGKGKEQLDHEHQERLRKIERDETMALKWKEIMALAKEKQHLQSQMDVLARHAYENRGGMAHLKYSSSRDTRFLSHSENQYFLLQDLRLSPDDFRSLTSSFDTGQAKQLSFFFEYLGTEPLWVKEMTSDWKWVPANPKLK